MVQVKPRPRLPHDTPHDTPNPLGSPETLAKLAAIEKLIAAIEDELADETLTDDLCLQRIGERLAQHRDDAEAREARAS